MFFIFQLVTCSSITANSTNEVKQKRLSDDKFAKRVLEYDNLEAEKSSNNCLKAILEKERSGCGFCARKADNKEKTSLKDATATFNPLNAGENLHNEGCEHETYKKDLESMRELIDKNISDILKWFKDNGYSQIEIDKYRRNHLNGKENKMD